MRSPSKFFHPGRSDCSEVDWMTSKFTTSKKFELIRSWTMQSDALPTLLSGTVTVMAFELGREKSDDFEDIPGTQRMQNDVVLA